MLRALLEATAGTSPAAHELVLGAFPARVVVDGAVVKAVTAGPFSGEDALFRLLLGPRRPVRTQPLASVAAVAGEVGPAAALLERFDAWCRDLEKATARAGGFARVWGVRYAALKTVLPGLPDEVKRVVRLIDGTRDLRTLLAESPLPPALTLRVVERLLAQGTLERADVADLDDAAADAPPTERDDRGADRSWIDARASRPPEAPTTTTTATTTTATTPEVSEPLLLSPKPPLVLETKKREPVPTTVAGASALPSAPKPKPELSAWLLPEDEFFQSHGTLAPAPQKQPWPTWALAVLVVVGAVAGALVARSFFP